MEREDRIEGILTHFERQYRGVIYRVTTMPPVFISIGMPITPYIIINAITKLPASINICMPIPACVIFDAITKPPIPISITST